MSRPLRIERLDDRRLMAADGPVGDEPLRAPPRWDLPGGEPGHFGIESAVWSVGPHQTAYLPPPPTETESSGGGFGSGDASSGHATMIDHGPSSNRVDIVFLGDGYTAAELETTYVDHIGGMLNHMFNRGEDPLPRYAKYFNAHRINTASNESGADKPAEGIFVDTAFDAHYDCSNIERLLCISTSKVNAALQAELAESSFDVDMRVVTVNDSKYGGSGGTYAVYAGGSSSAAEIALHELGHSFSDLADEYFNSGSGSYPGSEPREINVTTDPGGAKWSRWLGYSQSVIGTIGAYEGGRYYESGIYRPSQNSKMRSLGRPFDAVSREKIILDIYRIVDPLDGWRDNSAAINESDPLLWVDPIDPEVIETQWYVDGEPVAGATGETFRPAAFGYRSGEYQITAVATDPVEWVRTSRELLQQSVSWNVTVTAPPRVERVQLNGGDPQRSSLDRVEVTFSEIVEVAAGSPITVLPLEGDLTPLPLATEWTVRDGRSVAEVTFAADPRVTAVGSLIDGRYSLIVDAALISSPTGLLDGDDDGTGGGDFVFGEAAADRFYRRYGDADGNGTVNVVDFAALRGSFGKSLGDPGFRPELDAEGNGTINVLDFASFRSNFGS